MDRGSSPVDPADPHDKGTGDQVHEACLIVFIVGGNAGQDPPLAKGPGIAQGMDPFPDRHLAMVVLLLNILCAAQAVGDLFSSFQFFYFLPPHGASPIGRENGFQGSRFPSVS
jgi:hypothetical protein